MESFMSCNGFEKFTCGEWTAQQFETHARSCEDCQHAFEKDGELLELAHSLKTEMSVPHLWARIEHELKIESPPIQASDNYKWLFRMAALIVLAVGLGFLIHFNGSIQRSALLAESALKKVERQEQYYEQAIAELEKAVAPQLSRLDQELMLLYRDRLETIDEQISQCKEALATNPANAHIRRYLLAALQDKKETLKEIVNLTTNISAS
jgi:tetratricopeptide (TPR) repeat protein